MPTTSRPGRTRRRALVPPRRAAPLLLAGAAACALGAPAPASAVLAATEGGGSPTVLTPHSGGGKVVGELAARLPAASVGAVLGDANRATGPVSRSILSPWPANLQAARTFNAGDSSTTKWYPQGITGTGDATGDLVDGRRALLVSWYAKAPGGTSTVKPGVRVSFVGAEDLATATYRHVLLVVPKRTRDGRASFTWSTSHAGGIAWVGHRLYVAETDKGLSVYDTRRIWRVSTGDKSAVGCSPSACQAADYQYVMPKVATYRSSGGLRFSSVSFDRATNSLMTSEYADGADGTRIVRWPLGTNGGLKATGPKGAKQVRPVGTWIARNVTNIQGALSVGNTLYLSTSGGSPGLYVGPLGGALEKRAWPAGGEDLTYAPGSGRIYSVTEHEDRRAIFAVGG